MHERLERPERLAGAWPVQIWRLMARTGKGTTEAAGTMAMAVAEAGSLLLFSPRALPLLSSHLNLALDFYDTALWLDRWYRGTASDGGEYGMTDKMRHAILLTTNNKHTNKHT
ncbi:hypothetical protein E2C01_041364 [Portunus trituberculatus]|uniref:Uncharacterized protein n=1 Tax=Portunus trituberculatus TaxID=210409 RepID=A0A5B7FTE2_PORTR|nr:hypothetical protein [Portunus trituberculatus]